MNLSNLSELLQIIYWHNKQEHSKKLPYCFVPQFNESISFMYFRKISTLCISIFCQLAR